MTTKTSQLDAIHHIAVAVDDVKSAVEWYQKTFRCEIDYKDDTWAFLKFDNIKLALVIPGQHPPHIAFLSEQAEKYGTLKEHRDGSRSVYIKDTAGNSVEVVDKQSIRD